MLRHITTLCTLLLTLNACGANASNERPEPASPDISGRFLSPCTPSPQPDGSTSYFLLNFNLSETRWNLDYSVFGASSCAQEAKLLTVTIEGPYELTGPSSQPDVFEARFGFATKTLTPHMQGMVDNLVNTPNCGSGDWTLGQPSDISSGCAPFGQYPLDQCPADYDIVRLTQAGIEFGQRPADNNMCEASKRPTTLSGLVSARP
jgi:hypothetical protein